MAYKKIIPVRRRLTTSAWLRRHGLSGFGDDGGAGTAGTSVWNAATGGGGDLSSIATTMATNAASGAIAGGTATPSVLDRIGSIFGSILTPTPPVMTTMPIVPQTGMSNTTMLALAGGAVLAAVLILRKS